MNKFVILYFCAAVAVVSPHPLLQRCPQQCQCPVHNHQQNQLLNLLSAVPHQHLTTTPQGVNQPFNTPASSPHQCIPVKDQENQQFLSKVLENPLVKALQEQNSQQYQHHAQHSGNQPHIVNNYFIIPTEALLSEEDGKKDKAKHERKEAKNNNEHNHGKIKSSKDDDETHRFLLEYLNETPKKDHKSDVQNKKAVERHNCSDNEQPIEIVLEPTFAKIQERHEAKSASPQTQIDADEAVIQDVISKFPNMPEPLVRSLISVIKPRLQRFNPYQNHRHPYRQRVIAHDYGNSTIDERGNYWHQQPGQRRPFRRNPNRRRKLNNRNATVNSDVEGTTNNYERLDLKEATQVKPPATEFYKETETTTENPTKNSESKDVSKVIENTTPYVIYASHRDVELPELGTEDIIPNVDNGINYDYYPDFTKDNKARAINDAFHNYPEFYDEVVKSERKIGNDRVTQRGRLLDGKKTPKKVMRKLSERQNKAKHHERKHEDDMEKIVYRTPPGLESPDFKTVNVREYHNRNYQRPTYFSHEIEHFEGSTESATENEVNASNDEPTITYYIPNKPLETKRKKPVEKLETVFANSKIVNYGHSTDAFEGEATTIANIFSVNIAEEGTRNPFGDGTVLPAKAIVESEEFNW